MMKKQLRKELKSLRNQISPIQVASWSQKICSQILATSEYHQADIIFGYLAFGNEPNIDRVLEKALQDGKIVCVPQIVSKNEIRALRFSSFSQLGLDRYGIRSLLSESEVIEPSNIELVLVPGLGFGENGSRIGMGAGYYDRFLAQVKAAVLMGVTYNKLLHSDIPMESHDKRVQYLVTETNVTHCEQFVYKNF